MNSNLEAISIDPDYDRRTGYAPQFLGPDVPLPTLSTVVRDKAFKLPGTSGDAAFELRYHHFSVIMNREARLAFVAAVNYDAGAEFRHSRQGGDRWFFDPRVDAALQAGEEFYSGNPLDRGHLVRRADAGWGRSPEEAAQASDDTFHFTNCTPQHEIFNQATKARKQDLLLWGNIEEHVAAQATAGRHRVSVFNGPVFRATDRTHRGLRLPKEFWKIAVYVEPGERVKALAFIFSQEGLIADVPLEGLAVGPYRPYQIKIREIEARTNLDFGALRAADPLESGLESARGGAPIALSSLDDIVT
jgi:endonuclease G